MNRAIRHLSFVIALCFALCIPHSALCSDVSFPIYSVLGQGAAGRHIIITPLDADNAGAGLATGDTISTNLDNTGNLVLSNMAAGDYTLNITGPPRQKIYCFNVSANGTGGPLLYITNLTEDFPTTVYPPGTTSWSRQASDARYLSATNGILSSNAPTIFSPFNINAGGTNSSETNASLYGTTFIAGNHYLPSGEIDLPNGLILGSDGSIRFALGLGGVSAAGVVTASSIAGAAANQFDAAGVATNVSVARTYYVSPNGNDSWAGTELQPFATIAHASIVTSNVWLLATSTRQAVHVMAGDHTNDMIAGQRIRFQDYVYLIGDGGNYLEITNFNGSAVGGAKIRLGSHGQVRNMNIKDHDATGGTEAVFGFYGADGISDNGRSYLDDLISGCTLDGDSQLIHIEGNTTGDSIQYVVQDCTLLSDYNPVQVKNQTLPPLIEVTFFDCKISQTNRSGKAFNKPSCCIAGSNIGSGVGHTVKFVSCTFSYSDANTTTNAYFFFDNGVGGDVSGFSFSDCQIGPLNATNNATTADFNSLNAAGVVRDGGLRHIDGTPLTVWNGSAVVPVYINGGSLTNLHVIESVTSSNAVLVATQNPTDGNTNLNVVITNLNASQLNFGTVPLAALGNAVTNLLGGVPILGTNFGTSTLVTSEAIQGNDRAFNLGFLLSAAAQQVTSNYFPITLSQAVSTNQIVITGFGFQSWGTWTNSTSGNTATTVRFEFICTSNTVTLRTLPGTGPTASSMSALFISLSPK